MGVTYSEAYEITCPAGCRTKHVRRGHYLRERDGKLIQRYRCVGCRRSFSQATSDPCFRQKKRDLNLTIFLLLTGNFSQRRAARDLRINRKTVVRKFIFLAHWAKEVLAYCNAVRAPSSSIEFDDLETIEHTKCKPVSVTLVVESKTRWVLGFEVASMTANGRLAAIAKKKYGPRKDERRALRRKLLTFVDQLLRRDAIVKSDENPHYLKDVKELLPHAVHLCFKGQRARSEGFGELKKIKFDPLFAVNHTFAMFRANINRLNRRTWCTTKRKDRLAMHIAIYVLRHNLDLIN